MVAASGDSTESEPRVQRCSDSREQSVARSGLHLFSSWCASDDDAPSVGWSAVETEPVIVAPVGVDTGVAVGDKAGACASAIVLDSPSEAVRYMPTGKLVDAPMLGFRSQTPQNPRSLVRVEPP